MAQQGQRTRSIVRQTQRDTCPRDVGPALLVRSVVDLLHSEAVVPGEAFHLVQRDRVHSAFGR